MTVWIKELKEKFEVSNVAAWIYKNVAIRVFEDIDKVQIEDVIIISKEDIVTERDFIPFTVIVYEEYFEKIACNIMRENEANFDYYYLKNALAKAKELNTDTIITGLSYGLFGIDDSILNKEVNLSYLSQDLYYSLKGIYDVYQENKYIKNVVLCCGYYYFFMDMSKSQNPLWLQRVSEIYDPLFHDIHNCFLLPPKRENILYKSRIFDIQHILDVYSFGEYQKHYFNENRRRKYFANKEWVDKTKEWIQLNESEKVDAGKNRTIMHNKLWKRQNTLVENSIYFKELVRFCNEKNINLLVVVAPATKYYRENLYEKHRECFYEVLNSVEDGVIHLLDLFDDDNYKDEDFVDQDHLNKIGARKMTLKIQDILCEINS